MTSEALSFKKNRTALIDADMVAYRVSAMVEKDNGDIQDCEELTPSVISAWAREACCSDIIICKGTRSFRCDVYPEYKTNRKDKPKPIYLPVVRKIIESLDWTKKRVNGLEADDIQGIIASKDPDKFVIVNNDKDMLTIGGVFVYNPDKMDFPERTTKDEAEYNLWVRILTGDPTDNYKGIPKCGPVKACKILNSGTADMPMTVKSAYEEAGLSFEYLLQMCRCAKIITADLWNSETKTFTLWNPYEQEDVVV